MTSTHLDGPQSVVIVDLDGGAGPVVELVRQAAVDHQTSVETSR